MGRNSTSDPSVQPDVPPVLILVSLAEDFWGELDFFPLFDGALSCVTSLRGRLSGNLLFISSSDSVPRSLHHAMDARCQQSGLSVISLNERAAV